MPLAIVDDRISSGNCTDTALGISGVFTGVGEECKIFDSIKISIITDEDSAADGLEVQFSNDNATWTLNIKKFTVTNMRKQEFFVGILGRYARVVYTNGTTAQGNLWLRTVFKASPSDPLIASVDKFTSGVGLSGALTDAFGRVRVSSPRTVSSDSFLTTRGLDQWVELTPGTGGAISYTPGTARVNLTTTTDQSGGAIRQHAVYNVYQPGKSMFILATGVLEISGGVAGSISRIGLFDDNSNKTVDTVSSGDGFFFELNGTTLKVVKRSYITGGQVDDDIDQADWNIDKLDGSGNSGITIDPSKAVIYTIEKQWLGVGSVYMGVVINAKLIRCHVYHHANIGNTPYNTRASLPIRYEISRSGVGAGTEMRQICSAVLSEGGLKPLEKVYSANSFRTSVPGGIGSVVKSAIAIRLKAGRTRAIISPIRLTLICSSGADILISCLLYKPPTTGSPLTGAVWTSAGDRSAVEYDVSSTALDTANTTYPFDTVYSAYHANQADEARGEPFSEKTFLYSDIPGNSAIFVLSVIKSNGGGAELVFSSLTWKESE
jgi:hypothetical protein